MNTALPYPYEAVEVPLPDGPLRLWRPSNPDALFDALETLDADERIPYWAELWPSAIALASAIAVDAPSVRGRRVIELGCGLGLVSLAAARRGAAEVVATDWDEDALRFVDASAAALGLKNVMTRQVDWRAPPPDLDCDLLVAADVLYEARNVPWVAGAVRALLRPTEGAELWFSDPGRAHRLGLPETLLEFEGHAYTTAVRGPRVPTGEASVWVHRLRRLHTR